MKKQRTILTKVKQREEKFKQSIPGNAEGPSDQLSWCLRPREHRRRQISHRACAGRIRHTCIRDKSACTLTRACHQAAKALLIHTCVHYPMQSMRSVIFMHKHNSSSSNTPSMHPPREEPLDDARLLGRAAAPVVTQERKSII